MRCDMKRRMILVGSVAFVMGVIAGGYMFVDTQPRSFLALRDCGFSCYRSKDLAGLLASAGIQRASAFTPWIVKETDRCLAIKYPFTGKRYHWVIFPKKGE